ncbi:hypothetical protein NLI96_g8873 [Meripilus lineatus]|uniref:Uncharacterized protein n=1 Tax=Meripilus lineatus TaxID=2056292 RepID=A0AAD5UY71_9APHY|nr:hypothetical protein NLI96_g8873 [Physisporinus lineatus]
MTPTHSDRFISERPEFASLTTTPRTNRIARVFGLIDEKVLKYHEPLSVSHSNNLFIDIRANFSQLLSAPRNVSPTSSTSHLGKRQQFLLALDGPGVPTDPFAYPLTWSSNGTNTIAVACKRDVYLQDLDTRAITHLCKLKAQSQGRPMSIEWCFDQPRHLGVGTSSGSVQVWDSIQKEVIQEWMDKDCEPVGGMSWKGSLIAVGVESGRLGFMI